jgi:hypothetical protein
MTPRSVARGLPRPPRTRRSAGFSLLEVQVAFVLLGIGLAGVFPLVVMQMKLAGKIERGFDWLPQSAGASPLVTFRQDQRLISLSAGERFDVLNQLDPGLAPPSPDPSTVPGPPQVVNYLVPQPDPWERKLGVAASVCKTPSLTPLTAYSTNPNFGVVLSDQPNFTVSVQSVTVSQGSVTLRVVRTPKSGGG